MTVETRISAEMRNCATHSEARAAPHGQARRGRSVASLGQEEEDQRRQRHEHQVQVRTAVGDQVRREAVEQAPGERGLPPPDPAAHQRIAGQRREGERQGEQQGAGDEGAERQRHRSAERAQQRHAEVGHPVHAVGVITPVGDQRIMQVNQGVADPFQEPGVRRQVPAFARDAGSARGPETPVGDDGKAEISAYDDDGRRYTPALPRPGRCFAGVGGQRFLPGMIRDQLTSRLEAAQDIRPLGQGTSQSRATRPARSSSRGPACSRQRVEVGLDVGERVGARDARRAELAGGQRAHAGHRHHRQVRRGRSGRASHPGRGLAVQRLGVERALPGDDQPRSGQVTGEREQVQHQLDARPHGGAEERPAPRSRGRPPHRRRARPAWRSRTTARPRPPSAPGLSRGSVTSAAEAPFCGA